MFLVQGGLDLPATSPRQHFPRLLSSAGTPNDGRKTTYPMRRLPRVGLAQRCPVQRVRGKGVLIDNQWKTREGSTTTKAAAMEKPAANDEGPINSGAASLIAPESVLRRAYARRLALRSGARRRFRRAFNRGIKIYFCLTFPTFPAFAERFVAVHHRHAPVPFTVGKRKGPGVPQRARGQFCAKTISKLGAASGLCDRQPQSDGLPAY